MSLIDDLQPRVLRKPAGRVVRLLGQPLPDTRPNLRGGEHRRRSRELPDADVRVIRALNLLGVPDTQIAAMMDLPTVTVDSFRRSDRRLQAGQPSDNEVRAAAARLAEFAIEKRRG